MTDVKSSIAKSMLNMDPPKHTQIRSAVNRAFTPRVLKEWEPRIKDITDHLLKQAKNKGRIDIVKDLSYPLPVMVISELLGVPSERMDQFKNGRTFSSACRKMRVLKRRRKISRNVTNVRRSWRRFCGNNRKQTKTARPRHYFYFDKRGRRGREAHGRRSDPVLQPAFSGGK